MHLPVLGALPLVDKPTKMNACFLAESKPYEVHLAYSHDAPHQGDLHLRKVRLIIRLVTTPKVVGVHREGCRSPISTIRSTDDVAPQLIDLID